MQWNFGGDNQDWNRKNNIPFSKKNDQDYSRQMDFTENALGEKGIPVAQGSDYTSGTNPNFLSVEEIKLVNASNGF